MNHMSNFFSRFYKTERCNTVQEMTITETPEQLQKKFSNQIYMSKDDMVQFLRDDMVQFIKESIVKYLKDSMVVEIDNKIVLTICQDSNVAKGSIFLTNEHVQFIGKDFGDQVSLKRFVTSSKSTEMIFIIAPHGPPRSGNAMDEVNSEELSLHMMSKYRKQHFCKDQKLIVYFDDRELQLSVLTVTTSLDDGSKYARLSKHTSLEYMALPESRIKVTGKHVHCPQATFHRTFNFNDLNRDFLELGVGGLESEVKRILTKAFAARQIPNIILKGAGHKHVRGMVLYGPPGTGKTLVARSMAKVMNANIKVIRGPEIFNRYIGQSEANVRNIFADAINEYKEKGEKSRIHFIVIDELDSIAKSRGNTFAHSASDTVVNQLLTMIDGFEQMNNIFIVGTTNRLELIDPALLREGRLGIILKIDRPDEKGRLEILNIHSEKLQKMGRLSSNVNKPQIAKETEGWSGADLSGLIGNAFSNAITRAAIDAGGSMTPFDGSTILVTRDDFIAARETIRPKIEKHISVFLETCRTNGFIHQCGELHEVFQRIESLANRSMKNKFNSIESCIIQGSSGTGKTTLAATIAMTCEFTYVTVISPQLMVGFSESLMADHILQVMRESHGSPSSLILVDDIGRLISNASNGVVARALLSTLTCLPPKGYTLFVLGTTDVKLKESSCIAKAFSEVYEIQELNAQGIKTILENKLSSTRLFLDLDYIKAARDIGQIPIKKLYRALGYAVNEDNEFDGQSIQRCLNFLNVRSQESSSGVDQ